MNYTFYITRAAEWQHSAENPITAAEWKRLVEADRELIPDPHQRPALVSWRGSEIYPQIEFLWSEGRITAQNPDKTSVIKLLDIARRLDATLRGQDNEEWGDRWANAFDNHAYDENFARQPGRTGFLARLKKALGIR